MLDRRHFLGAAAGVGGAAALGLSESAFAADQSQYFEMRQYHTRIGGGKAKFNAFMRDVMIPALNRNGIEPVGVFSVKHGQNAPTVYVFLPHPNIVSAVTLSSQLLADEEFKRKGASVLNASLDDPGYVRFSSKLMRAFDQMPKPEVPVKSKSRIFEMRIYEGHSIQKNKTKVEMFNEGGEIALFRKTGLNPVFFGETLIGPRMPNLTYMLAFEDYAEREQAWQTFINHPEWDKMKNIPKYKGTVSNITDLILTPMGYSQI